MCSPLLVHGLCDSLASRTDSSSSLSSAGLVSASFLLSMRFPHGAHSNSSNKTRQPEQSHVSQLFSNIKIRCKWIRSGHCLCLPPHLHHFQFSRVGCSCIDLGCTGFFFSFAVCIQQPSSTQIPVWRTLSSLQHLGLSYEMNSTTHSLESLPTPQISLYDTVHFIFFTHFTPKVTKSFLMLVYKSCLRPQRIW